MASRNSGFDPLTNIGASVPPQGRLTGPPPQFIPGTGQALPVGVPVAGEEAGPRVLADDPLWVSRWQSSTSPPGQRPWVRGYRWWVANVAYQSWGPVPAYRIDFLWKGHRHAYHGIPRDVWEHFRAWTGSVGEWFHDNILVPGWNGKTVRGARYPNFAL